MITQIASDVLPPETVARAVEIARLLADPVRLRIVWSLLHDEHAVHELADHVGANPPAVSQHLARLRAAGVVQRRREHNTCFYSCRDPTVAAVTAELVSRCAPDVAGQEGEGPLASAATRA